MNQVDENINRVMIDSDLIDVDSLDFSDDQTWLFVTPEDSGNKVDIVDWCLSCDWPHADDPDYVKQETEFYEFLDNLLKNEYLSMPDKHKFDSRTFVRPGKRVLRPSLQTIVSSPIPKVPAMLVNQSAEQVFNQSNASSNKYLTYNKYNSPRGPISPMLRLKTFNVDANTDNSNLVKEYAMKRRSLVQDEQLEDIEVSLISDMSGRLSNESSAPTKPITIDYSQPAHNFHNTFTKGITMDRGSFNMYQSGESLMRMSPPSLVSSLHMENSGNFNTESLERKLLTSQKEPSGQQSTRESLDPMMTSMTLSILDEKEMSTSFLSQVYTENDSLNLLDSMPPSLVNSMNTSYIIPNMAQSKTDSMSENNVFSSATFTHLEQSEKLLSARPRHQMFNSFTKRDSGVKMTESYTKSKEESCQIDKTVLNDADSNSGNTSDMSETITLHYANNKFKRNLAGKENLNETFEKDDAFYGEMGVPKPVDERASLNVTLDKRELNQIIQARQKLSLARQALPTDENLPNHIESPTKIIQLPNQTIVVPKQSMDNASELLSRRRNMNGNTNHDEMPARETPKRNSTFRKPSPKKSMDMTVILTDNIIDINSATLNLVDAEDKTLKQEEWGLQDRAMVGSSESTDTGTFSSSSPPESVPDAGEVNTYNKVISTPMVQAHKKWVNDVVPIDDTLSPIYGMSNENTLQDLQRTYDANVTAINSATIVRKHATAKRDILAAKTSPEKRVLGPKSPPQRVSPPSTGSSLMPPPNMLKKSGLPTSKLRQYSSHKELNRIPGSQALPARASLNTRGGMTRRTVFASNPALGPTAPVAPPIRRDSYTLTTDAQEADSSTKPTIPTPALVRQGTETLRRERPQSQLIAPKEPPTSRPYSISGASQLRVSRPASASVPSAAQRAVANNDRPSTGNEATRMSALPRPSRLPAPRRGLRPPSVYSVAPTADIDQY